MGKCSWIAFINGVKALITFVFSHVGLCALVLGYSIAGAFLFSWLEQKAIPIPYNATEHLEKCMDEIFNITESYGVSIGGDVSVWRLEIMKSIKLHEMEVTEAVQEDRYNKTTEDLEERWNIINSLFFCVTVITTIGYGHISPRTTNGRLVTIFYSILGIPLMLLCLNNIGDSMASTFRFTYRRIFCCHSKKQEDNLPEISEKTDQRPDAKDEEKERSSYQPPLHYKPKRSNMLISPPISATIHRGSDLPVKLPTDPKPPASPVGGPSLSSSAMTRTPSRPSNLSPCVEYDVNSILAECATYAGSSIPDYNPSPDSQRATPCHDYDFIPTQKTITPSPSPPAVSAPSLNHSVPSSPLSKEVTTVWFTDHESAEPYLTVPSMGDGPYSAQSTRPASPSSGWVDQNSIMSMSSNERPWMLQDSSASVTWVPPLDCGEAHVDQKYHQRHHHHHKRPAGKTVVVYNTLSGDALKQQTKIQRKMALQRSKHGQMRNDVTTVFTDPVSGQAVNGDMLGLNYRPIEVEPSDKDTRVPMFLVLSFVFSYLVMGAVLFSSLESWHFLDSFYFCYITLSTIGFGDLVPGNLGYESREAQIKLVALSLYVLVGLAVLAMSFSLVQEEVILKCKAFAQHIGLKDE